MPTRNDRAHVPHRRAPISIVKDYLVSAVGEQLHHVAAVPTVGIPHPRTRPSVCALRGTPRATRATRRPAWRRRWSRPCTEGWPGPGRRGTMIELPSSFDDSIFRSAAVPPEETGEDLAGANRRDPPSTHAPVGVRPAWNTPCNSCNSTSCMAPTMVQTLYRGMARARAPRDDDRAALQLR
jgi:hypothetical protein